MKMENVRYSVVKSRGIIRASITDCEYDAIMEFNKRFVEHSTSAFGVWVDKDNSRFVMPRKFSVTVRLHPDDVWDEKRGKDIATRRLAEKYNNSLDKHLFNIYKAFMKSMDKMETYLSDHHLIE